MTGEKLTQLLMRAYHLAMVQVGARLCIAIAACNIVATAFCGTFPYEEEAAGDWSRMVEERAYLTNSNDVFTRTQITREQLTGLGSGVQSIVEEIDADTNTKVITVTIDRSDKLVTEGLIHPFRPSTSPITPTTIATRPSARPTSRRPPYITMTPSGG